MSEKQSNELAPAVKIWSAAQSLLRTMLNADIYNLWFATIRGYSFKNDTLILQVANDFCEVWLKDNYMGVIRDAIGHVVGKQVNVKFRVAEQIAQKAPSNRVLPPPAQNDEQLFDALAVKLNPKNTFESFVVGETNNHAHAAAFAVAQNPGKSYSPLFVYGGVGLGKTHLLHAIGQYVRKNTPNARVVYVSSEKFVNEYINAIQNNQLVQFRKEYRQVNVLLIDDIQFLAGKERIQEEFFHTFNALHESHKQIVLTCDRPASEIQNLEQRLVSRFEWGLVTDLQPPNAETRLAILQKKAKIMGINLPPEVLDFLAKRIRTNVRRLEGALIRVSTYCALTGKKLTLELVEQLLRNVLYEENRFTINIDVIQKIVAEHFDIPLADMTSKRRPENIAFPRQIAMFLSRHMTESSLRTIGEAFGGRDASVVLHGCSIVKDKMAVDPNVRQIVSYLEKRLVRG